MKKTEEGIGLGDIVENIIKVVLPKTAERKKDCIGCKKRKENLNEFRFRNNFNANIK